MGSGIMGDWFIVKSHIDHRNKKSIESMQINQYSAIPSFHYSIFPIKDAKLKNILIIQIAA
jgi:hypothetical protein